MIVDEDVFADKMLRSFDDDHSWDVGCGKQIRLRGERCSMLHSYMDVRHEVVSEFTGICADCADVPSNFTTASVIH